ncbi:hypothetical protein HQ585_18165 [candidate division KSB1 bacterium]|nr:hypothetical protein [candidate division KSB1 bacterium]
MRRWCVLFIIAGLLIAGCQKRADSSFQSQLINLDHLDYLCEDVIVEGDSVSIVHIYADYPDYEWLDAGDEGIACVDDAARAVVVYLHYYELSGTVSALNRARKLLDFVMALQCDDGEFYNFINADYTINRTGKTSLKSFDFWAARGYWAIAWGYRIFRDMDQEYASLLKDRFLKCKLPLRSLMKRYGKYDSINGKEYPTWLINRYGSDATSELLLGMAQYFRIEKDNELEEITGKLVKGLLDMQLGDNDPYPGVFLSWKGVWHAYANCQTQTLSELARILDRPSWLTAARKEADLFYPKLIEEGFFYSIKMEEPPEIKQFSQIAYGARPVISGLVRLSEATCDEAYAVQAGLAAAWFFGKNAPQLIMYDIKTGRCFDGINDAQTINLNSGAESTIEALMSLLDVASYPKTFEELNRWIKVNRNSNEGN